MEITELEQKPIYIILGTRAQFIKMAPVIKRLEEKKIAFDLIFTQQHIETINDIIENFGIKTPLKYIVKRKQEAKTIKLFAGWGIQMLLIFLNPFSRKKIFRNGRGLIITHGDTVTAAWAAIYGKTSFCKVMHVESGLRSFNLLKPFPEEIMRIITFTFSDYYACPNAWAVKNLKHFHGKKINTGTNTMYDALQFALKNPDNHKFTTKLHIPKRFALVSIHRAENIFNKKQLNLIIQYLNQISKKINLVMILHPATKQKLISTDLYQVIESNKNIILLDRQDFFTFVAITAEAEFVITDGGSNQEEMSYIGKPTLLMRKETERIEGLNKNIVLSKFDEKVIMNFISDYEKFRTSPIKLKVSASEKITDFIQDIIYGKI